jgi:1-aminocyclopropane-1-carboxylate deaminase/D-cysteine desulfhydrase-like pyridoxal-dependent ACC family enzyme
VTSAWGDFQFNLPRLKLGHFPTPMEEVPPLSERLGVRLLIKREDLSGLAFGGNKVRKLEHVLGAPRFRDADVLLTSGGAQSNHARETAAAAARLGKRSKVFLRTGGLDAAWRGNLLIDELLGADVVLVDAADYEPVNQAILREQRELVKSGIRAEIVPLGAASGEAVWGWAEGAIELLSQARTAGASPDALLLPAGTGSTAIGLALGLALVGQTIPVHAVSASWSAERLTREAQRLLAEAAHLGDCGDAAARAQGILCWHDTYVGPGYTVPTEAGVRALRELAQESGIIADLTYTAKTLGGLIELIEQGIIAQGSTVAYLHTGGACELFARSPETVTGRKRDAPLSSTLTGEVVEALAALAGGGMRPVPLASDLLGDPRLVREMALVWEADVEGIPPATLFVPQRFEE